MPSLTIQLIHMCSNVSVMNSFLLYHSRWSLSLVSMPIQIVNLWLIKLSRFNFLLWLCEGTMDDDLKQSRWNSPIFLLVAFQFEKIDIRCRCVNWPRPLMNQLAESQIVPFPFKQFPSLLLSKNYFNFDYRTSFHAWLWGAPIKIL